MGTIYKSILKIQIPTSIFPKLWTELLGLWTELLGYANISWGNGGIFLGGIKVKWQCIFSMWRGEVKFEKIKMEGKLNVNLINKK